MRVGVGSSQGTLRVKGRHRAVQKRSHRSVALLTRTLCGRARHTLNQLPTAEQCASPTTCTLSHHTSQSTHQVLLPDSTTAVAMAV